LFIQTETGAVSSK